MSAVAHPMVLVVTVDGGVLHRPVPPLPGSEVLITTVVMCLGTTSTTLRMAILFVVSRIDTTVNQEIWHSLENSHFFFVAWQCQALRV